jgi:hypothetical protein
LFLSSIIVGHDARLQLGELVPASLNANMANFLSFDVYDIDLKKKWYWFFEGYEWFQSEFYFFTNDKQVYHHCGRPRLIFDGEMDGDWRGVGKIGSRLENNTTPNTYLFKKIKIKSN